MCLHNIHGYTLMHVVPNFLVLVHKMVSCPNYQLLFEAFKKCLKFGAMALIVKWMNC